MQTNQSSDPSQTLLPPLACQHAVAEGSIETCAYLRTIERVRMWVERATQAYRDGDNQQPLLGELFLLFAEVQAAYDLCPDHVTSPVPVVNLH